MKVRKKEEKIRARKKNKECTELSNFRDFRIHENGENYILQPTLVPAGYLTLKFQF